MLQRVMVLAEAAFAAATPQAASAAFFDAVQAQGATYLQTRIYRRPDAPLTSRAHWAAGGFVARYTRPDWVGSDAFNYICFDHNPLLGAIRGGHTRYRFSDFAPHEDIAHGAYWDALGEAGIGDALCATAYGSERRIASLHVGFDEAGLSPELAETVTMAANILAEKLIAFDAPAGEGGPAQRLSVRERDAIAFVAEGKTDWEIAQIMGVSESTARFHVDNARRKLEGVNRAHAVARFMAMPGAY